MHGDANGFGTQVVTVVRIVYVCLIVLTIGSWAIFIKGLSLVIPLWPAFMTA